MLADELDDIERARIAAENRLRAWTTVNDQSALDAIGQEVSGVVNGLAALEKSVTKALERAMKSHPLGPWVESQTGVGRKQAARLLSAIGDPYVKPPVIDRDTGEVLEPERPRRGPAELWQFCGHGDPARSRKRKGVRVEFSPEAKMRTRLVATSCMKQTKSPYRAVYDRARAAWAGRDVTDGHAHSRALRIGRQGAAPGPLHRGAAPGHVVELHSFALPTTDQPMPKLVSSGA